MNRTEAQLIVAATQKEEDPFIRDRNHLFLSLLWITAGRLSEVLKIADSDIENSKITIHAAPGKGIDRVLDIGSDASKVHEYIENWNLRGYLFESIDRNSVRNMIAKYCKDVGLEPVNPHDFRNGRAKELMDGGASSESIKGILGHTGIQERIPSHNFRHADGVGDSDSGKNVLSREQVDKLLKIPKSDFEQRVMVLMLDHGYTRDKAVQVLKDTEKLFK
ncbi:integrase [Methanohalophilus levihalophilus]|uniref:tyrosine-type recombinase/integrase n=1 Tax=Methanohalophilus levihalophilus TaxID=1431282 RepID=UPI001AE17C34|nr:site-specific integrase [Methanohalophilus levihalophilus]MBP2029358.1 integrase [Methanohalophilus levihalophilus]